MILCAGVDGTFRDAQATLVQIRTKCWHVLSVFLTSASHVSRRVTDAVGVGLGFCNRLNPTPHPCDLSPVQLVTLNMPSDIRSFFGGKPSQGPPDTKPVRKEVSSVRKHAGQLPNDANLDLNNEGPICSKKEAYANDAAPDTHSLDLTSSQAAGRWLMTVTMTKTLPRSHQLPRPSRRLKSMVHLLLDYFQPLILHRP